MGFQVAEENLLRSMMFTFAVRRTLGDVEVPLGGMVVVRGQEGNWQTKRLG